VAEEVEWFMTAADAAREGMPRVADWMIKNPMHALGHRNDWLRLVDTVSWIEQNHAPVYVRQVDVPGVDTKFIENHRRILTDLLEGHLETSRVDWAAPRSDFVARFRLRVKPSYVRLRLLDEASASSLGFGELTVRTDELATPPRSVSTVYVVENEITYLAFPPLAHSVAVFGGGYAVPTLHRLDWLDHVELIYWGDVDTHGFAILDHVRRRFPHTRSMLMSVKTLMDHEQHWGTEPSQTTAPLTHLTSEEAELYCDLIEGTYGPSIRLEQERVRYSALCDELGLA
jgi:hypothetical protein